MRHDGKRQRGKDGTPENDLYIALHLPPFKILPRPTTSTVPSPIYLVVMTIL